MRASTQLNNKLLFLDELPQAILQQVLDKLNLNSLGALSQVSKGLNFFAFRNLFTRQTSAAYASQSQWLAKIDYLKLINNAAIKINDINSCLYHSKLTEKAMTNGLLFISAKKATSLQITDPIFLLFYKQFKAGFATLDQISVNAFARMVSILQLISPALNNSQQQKLLAVAQFHESKNSYCQIAALKVVTIMAALLTSADFIPILPKIKTCLDSENRELSTAALCT